MEMNTLKNKCFHQRSCWYKTEIKNSDININKVVAIKCQTAKAVFPPVEILPSAQLEKDAWKNMQWCHQLVDKFAGN